jgi:glutaredoxin
MVKEFLSREGHPFETKNIEEDDAAYDELMKLGARSVPVTVIAPDHAAEDVQVITGFDQARLRAALTAAGGGSSQGR